MNGKIGVHRWQESIFFLAASDVTFVSDFYYHCIAKASLTYFQLSRSRACIFNLGFYYPEKMVPQVRQNYDLFSSKLNKMSFGKDKNREAPITTENI